MTITTNEYDEKLQCYIEALDVIGDFKSYSKFAMRLSKFLTSLLGETDPKYAKMIGEATIAMEREEEALREIPQRVDLVDFYAPDEPVDPKSLMYFANLEKCVVLEERGLTYHVIKEGYEAFIAISHFEDETVKNMKFGVQMDLKVKSARSWILKKDKNGKPKLDWKVYEP